MKQVFWVLLVATLAVWLMTNLATVPRIEGLARDLRLLDMRFTGYSFAEAQAFISAIGEEGISLYLGAQFWLDMIFPPLLGAVLIISMNRKPKCCVRSLHFRHSIPRRFEDRHALGDIQ